MKIKFAELPTFVNRALKFVPPGETREGTLKMQYSRLTMQEAADLVVAHDAAVAPTENDGDRKADKADGQTYVDRAAWLHDCMVDHLKGWSLEDGETGEAYAITEAIIEQFLSVDVFFWATYRDWLDYLTKIANGKAKSEQDAEIKNLLNSARGAPSGKRGALLA